MTIRWRLTLWHFFSTFFILLLFSAGIYIFMRKQLYRAVDQQLDTVVKNIRNNYNPGTKQFDIVRLDSIKENPFLSYYLIVYDETGRPVYSSPLSKTISLPVPLSVKQVELEEIVERKVPQYDQYLHPDGKGEVTFRAINRKIFFNKEQIGWVTVASAIEKVEESLRKLLATIALLIAVVSVLIGVSGFFLTRKSMRPVDVITSKANHISYTNLNERINGVTGKDELGRLSDTLNHLLDRLQNAFDSQRQFLADAAHELKTPLSVLRAHWESELNNEELSLEFREKLVHDVETVSRLTHLINNLLLLAKTEDIQTSFSFSDFELKALLQDVISDAGILADLKEQKLVVKKLIPVKMHGDRDRLYQLFFNLVENAIKYTQDSGEIVLSMQEPAGRIAVKIEDNGPGIPTEDMPHIFDRFYRVQKDRSRKTGGSGLGLTICKLIVEAHNGKIEAESEPGKGSIFRVVLPHDNVG
ncbi:MAG TPA: HAMP domain-containing protein [Bacteroidetes bacterium]|nr:HAMP domain-containing protein [Bacteroidota bacterium]